MTRSVPITTAVSDDDLVRVVDTWLAREGRRTSVVALRRRSWEYATSALLELVTTTEDDGTERHLVLKHLGRHTLTEKARRAKPSFAIDPQREIEVYRRILAPLHVGPGLVGFSISPQRGPHWLLIEHVPGFRLSEAGEVGVWMAVARWLGALHQRLATFDSQQSREQARLIEYDRRWYTAWLNRALRFFAAEDPSQSRRSRDALKWLAARYERVIERLTSIPSTVIHGEFYPENIVVAGTADSPLVCPVDWEMTAIGPGIIDLAALTSGQWSEEHRRAVMAAYAAGSALRAGTTLDELAESVEYANIHLAVQWLGWFGRRRTQPAHAQDWLADAVGRAEALRL